MNKLYAKVTTFIAKNEGKAKKSLDWVITIGGLIHLYLKFTMLG